jgi:hypothetical protein
VTVSGSGARPLRVYPREKNHGTCATLYWALDAMSSDEEHGGEARPRRRKRGLLKLYYGSTAQEEVGRGGASDLHDSI